MKSLKKITVEDIDRKEGFDMHDRLRDGRNAELDPIKVSATMSVLVNTANEMIVAIEEAQGMIKDLQEKIKRIGSPVKNKPGRKAKTQA